MCYKNRVIGVALITILSASLLQCRSMEYMEMRDGIEQSFASENYGETVEVLNDGSYRSQDEVLQKLELAMSKRYAGDIPTSNRHFHRAESLIDSLYGTSVTRNMRAFAVNDYQLEYEGEDYENIYLNVFKALNYLHMDEYQSARIESRRISHKLSNYVDRHRRMADSTDNSAEDRIGTSLEDLDFEIDDDDADIDEIQLDVNEAEVEHSPLGHYLTAIISAKQGDEDAARIEHESMLQAFDNHGRTDILDNPSRREQLGRIRQPETYNTLVMAFSGRAPVKEENRIAFYFPSSSLRITMAFPSLTYYDSRVDHVTVAVNQQEKRLLPIEPMAEIAGQVYQVRLPLIYARTILRSYARAIGSREASDAVADEYGAGAGLLSNIALGLASEAVESADLRSWTTLPGMAHSTTLHLPEGRHEVEVRYKNRSGRTIHTETHDVEAGEQDEDLELVEDIYWN